MAAPPAGLVVPNEGFHDVATPFHNATYEEEHLQISDSLRSNFSYAYCPSGHVIYSHLPSLKALHDNVARFIEENSNQTR